MPVTLEDVVILKLVPESVKKIIQEFRRQYQEIIEVKRSWEIYLNQIKLYRESK